MKWLTVSVLAMLLVAPPPAEASFITVTTDAFGTATQVFFDESALSEADKIAAGPSGFTVFFLSSHIPEIDGASVFLVEAGSTLDRPLISDVVEVMHTFGHGDGRTEVVMRFISAIDGVFPLYETCFPCGRSVVETGDIQDITELFPGNLPFRVLVRSDVPEPSTLVLLGLGLAALACITWRGRRRA